jgi:hypothetical protein
MEKKPLAVLLFNELFGLFESGPNPREKDYVQHRLHIRRGVARFMDDLLSRCQVALLIDVNNFNVA